MPMVFNNLNFELQTVPGFDTSNLKRELSQVQQRFGFLGEGLTEKMGSLDSQLVIWKQIEQSRDDILSWSADTQKIFKKPLKTCQIPRLQMLGSRSIEIKSIL